MVCDDDITVIDLYVSEDYIGLLIMYNIGLEDFDLNRPKLVIAGTYSI